ncbi:hypothetical protein Q3P08_10730 [Ralstonia pseudosolanacearum]|nr:hypothetical protein [Ralstonia pseudosolanacearum]
MTKIGIGLCLADSQIYLRNEMNNGKRGESSIGCAAPAVAEMDGSAKNVRINTLLSPDMHRGA